MIRLIIISVFAVTLVGCEKDKPEPSESAPGVSEQDQPATAIPEPVEPAPEPKTANQYAEAVINFLRWRDNLTLKSLEEIKKSTHVTVAGSRRFRKTVLDNYTTRNYALHIAQGPTLSEDGQLAVDLILDVESHGLEPSPYPIAVLKAAKSDYDNAHEALKKLSQGQPDTPRPRRSGTRSEAQY